LHRSHEELKRLKIGALESSTTLSELQKSGRYPDVVVISPEKQQDQRKGTNALERALSALDNQGSSNAGSLQIDALASDASILLSFLQYAVLGSESGSPGDFVYVKRREAYQNKGFAIFPSREFPWPGNSNQHLPETALQNYAMAIRKDSIESKWLEKKIDTILDLPKLREKKQELQAFEAAQLIATPTPIPKWGVQVDASNDGKQVSVKQTIDWWAILLVLIPVIGTIIVAILNPQLVSLVLSELKNKLTGTQSLSAKNRRLFGIVRDELGNPVSNASVFLEVAKYPSWQTITDSNGEFIFQVPPDDLMKVRVEAVGYKTYRKNG
jgi:Carboxypeptidase regulatory-like domain